MKRSYFQESVLYGHQLPIKKTIQARRTRHAGHCRRSRDELVSDVLLWTPAYGLKKQDDQLAPTYSSYVRIRDVALKTCQRRWTIGRSVERGSGISVPVVRHDDDDDDDDSKSIFNIFVRLYNFLCAFYSKTISLEKGLTFCLHIFLKMIKRDYRERGWNTKSKQVFSIYQITQTWESFLQP